MAVSFSCPECGKTLKSASPIAPGKRVKCPGCGVAFSPTADDETATAVQAKVPVKVGARIVRRDDEDDALPRSKAGVTARKPAPRIADDEDDEPRPSKSRRDDDDEDDDDRPKKKKKKGKKQAGSKLPLILALSGAGVLLVVFGVTAFLWPGFLLSKGDSGAVAKNDKKGGGNNKNEGGVAPVIDLFAYCPNNAIGVVGVHVAALKDFPGFEDSIGISKKDKQFPLAALLPDCELMVSSGTVSKPEESVIIVQTQSAYDKEALKKTLDPVVGQLFYRVRSTSKFDKIESKQFVAMPHDRVAVFGSMSEAAFGKLLASAAKGPSVSPDIISGLKSVDSGQLYGAVLLTKEVTEDLSKANKKTLGALASAVPAIQRGKSVTFAVNRSDSIKLNATMICASESDAAQIKDSVNSFVKKDLKGLVEGLIAMVELGEQLSQDVPKGTAKAYRLAITDLENSLKLSTQGAILSGAAEVSAATVQELAKLAPKKDTGLDGKGGFPDKGFPKDVFKDKGPFPGGMQGGFPGGMQGGFPGGMQGGFPGGMQGGFPGGGMQGGIPKDGFQFPKDVQFPKDGFQFPKDGIQIPKDVQFPKDGFQFPKDGVPFPKDVQIPKGGFPGGFPKDAMPKDGVPGGFPGGNPGGNPGGALNLAGTTWAGTEQLRDFGNLTFVFGQNNQVTMIDAAGQSPGSYRVNGNSITLDFPGKCTYTGNVNGTTLAGNGRDDRNFWTFTVQRK